MCVCDTNTNFKSAEHINTLLCVTADTNRQHGLEANMVCGRSRAVLTNFEAVKNLFALNSW